MLLHFCCIESKATHEDYKTFLLRSDAQSRDMIMTIKHTEVCFFISLQGFLSKMPLPHYSIERQ